MSSVYDPLTAVVVLPQGTGALTGQELGLWLIACYGMLIAVLALYAAHVTLSKADAGHRADAYKVLKLVWGTATGVTGLLAVAVHLTGIV